MLRRWMGSSVRRAFPACHPPTETAARQKATRIHVSKKVLINVEDKDIRVAVLESGQLTQLFVEPLTAKSIVGNIYKGKVESIVPGLQAVFVDIGMERNAFLHFADVNDAYHLPHKGGAIRSKGEGSHHRDATARPAKDGKGHQNDDEAVGDTDAEADAEDKDDGKPARKRAKEKKPARTDLKIGDEVLVQVTKEPLGTKGARVSSYISLPGRYLVFLPFSSQNGGGVSRRIEDGTERKRLRTILRELKADEGSFIIRTAGLEREKEEISADVHKLTKIWSRIRRSAAQRTAPSLVHDEHDILGRLVRDELTHDVDELLIDSKPHGKILQQVLASTMPDLKAKVTVTSSLEENLFDKFEVETQFQKALRNRVWLKSGGYIIIDEVEALVAIDVNTGKFVGKGDQEATIFQTNLEAAETIARQLRLRDVGGIIVIDFIDMKSRESQNALVRRMKELLKKDRAKTTVAALTEYGILQMTRKRVRQSLSKTVFRQCPYCQGSGRVLAEPQIWKAIKYEILRALKSEPKPSRIEITLHPQMRTYVEDEVLETAKGLADYGQIPLDFAEDKGFHLEHFEVAKIA
jgi:ribonuclease G